MLVVDLHTLQTVNVLHFVDDVTREFFYAQEAQDVLWIGWTVHHGFTFVDHLALVHHDVLLFGHQVFPHVAVWISDLQANLAFGFFTEGDRTGQLGQGTFVLRRTRLEQLGNPWQTTRNVAGLLTLDWHACQDLTRANFLAITHLNQGANLEANRHGVVCTWNLHFFAIGVEQLHHGAYGLGRAATLRVNHHE